jgi:signal transduction histidine kinase
MRLAEFIGSNPELILKEWVAFARTILPGVNMDALALRDHAGEILLATSNDMRTSEQAEIYGKTVSDEILMGASEKHAIGRLGYGFGLMEVVSEYRALRASVLRLWAASGHQSHEMDIADVGRFNASIDKSLEKAVSSYTRRIDQSRDMFLAILSHDLRNPLNSISMLASLLDLCGSAAPQAEGAVTQISTNVNVMARMISDLLDYTRTRLGAGMPVNPVLMDLRQICSDLIAEYRSAHPTRDIRTKIEGQLWGHWDADRLRQAISNLLGNAIQHSPAEAVVSLNVTGTETDIVLVVWNDGSTIPPGEMPNIFDPLIRGSSADHPAVNRPGSIGLGLYIAREIIISHGGTIGATSTEKDGTAFTISLPRDYLLKSGSPILDSTHIETM